MRASDPDDPKPRVDVRQMTIAGRHGDVPARVYRSGGQDPKAALMWVHGGGFLAGDLDMPEAHWVGLQLAARGISVLSVDYRKCVDGVHYPIPSDDILDTWLWVTERTVEELGTNPGRLHIGGASAGGNLVAGVTKRLRDGAELLPASAVLVYPLLHHELPAPGEGLRGTLAGRVDLLSPEIVRGINLNWSGSEAMFEDVYAFPANGDVSGQPPLYVLNSEVDTLRTSGEAYAALVAAAGGTVRVEFEPGTGHGHLNSPEDPGAIRSIERIEGWIVSQDSSTHLQIE